MVSVVTTQRDFSAGEIDVSAKRDETNPAVKAGLRQASNLRILNTKAIQNRPGRRALFSESGRVDEVLMSPGNKFFICFGAGTLRVKNASGVEVAGQTGFAWGLTTVQNVVWALYGYSIYITFPGQQPQILTWDGVSQSSSWAITPFTTQSIGNQKRTVFYRIAAHGITLTVSATTGTINLTFSANVLTAPMVGTRIRFNGKQMTIASVTNGTTGTATVNETLVSNRQTVNCSAFVNAPAVGDVVTQIGSGAVGKVISVAATSFVVELTSSTRFDAVSAHTVFNGITIVCVPTTVVDAAPTASVVWDQEVMNAAQGWPASVFVDQNRLGFCNFPAVPSGIAWSAELIFDDFYPDAFAADGLSTDAIFELAPNKSQVLYVAAGAESNEFVFCDNAVYYIPITPTNPLRPGSVGFNFITADGSASVQPRLIDEVMLYITAGKQSVMALTATGSYTRFYRSIDITDMYSHLFNAPVAIAAPTAGGTFSERYVYVLNGDGTIAVGRYSSELKDLKRGVVGWLPWSGGGTVKWISSLSAEVIFTTNYAPNGIASVSLVGVLDDTQYLDAAQLYNTQPAGLPIPGGKGPLWYIAGGTVDLIDQTTRVLSGGAVSTIGNMTALGGLAAAFDGAPVKAQAASADLAAADGYVGINYGCRQILGAVLAWPSSDQGFAVGGSGNVTLDLYGNTAAPASVTDGTLLATVVIANQTTGPVAIAPNYNTTGYQYVWVRIRKTSATAVVCAQLVPLVGPTWWLNGGSVTYGARMMGTYQVDANGFLVAQNNAGEDFTSATLVAGQPWTARLEPFLPAAQPGQDMGQRMWPRRLQRFEVYVVGSSGFVLERLYSDQSGANLPALGTVQKMRRIPAWNVGDDPTLPPPLRERSYLDRPLGRSHDPREVIVKDTPGPLTILEISTEVTI
jgi:hypothetical protein